MTFKEWFMIGTVAEEVRKLGQTNRWIGGFLALVVCLSGPSDTTDLALVAAIAFSVSIICDLISGP